MDHIATVFFFSGPFGVFKSLNQLGCVLVFLGISCDFLGLWKGYLVVLAFFGVFLKVFV